jgi:hypothetical protein
MMNPNKIGKAGIQSALSPVGLAKMSITKEEVLAASVSSASLKSAFATASAFPREKFIRKAGRYHQSWWP